MDATAWIVVATVATAAVALYAAILSTITFFKDLQDKRPQVNISLSYGLLAYPTGAKGRLLVQLSNPGMRPVTITSVSLRLPTGNSMIFPNLEGTQPLAAELTSGQSATYWMIPQAVAETLRENDFSGAVSLRAICHDGTDNVFQSKPFDFDLSSKMANED